MRGLRELDIPNWIRYDLSGKRPMKDRLKLAGWLCTVVVGCAVFFQLGAYIVRIFA